jgi:hypothetical protein
LLSHSPSHVDEEVPSLAVNLATPSPSENAHLLEKPPVKLWKVAAKRAGNDAKVWAMWIPYCVSSNTPS